MPSNDSLPDLPEMLGAGWDLPSALDLWSRMMRRRDIDAPSWWRIVRAGPNQMQAVRGAVYCQEAGGRTDHYSDCAVHRAPAYEPGPCNCGGIDTSSHLKEPTMAKKRKGGKRC